MSSINDRTRAMLTKAACGHPLRTGILASYMTDDIVHSPNEIATLLGERVPNVAYHVRILLDAGILQLASTVQRRGALEHYYRLDRDRLRELRTVLRDHVALIERLAAV